MTMARADQIIIGNNAYRLVESRNHHSDCRRKCAFRHRCFNPEYAHEIEVHISTGEVVTTRTEPCKVLARLAKGRFVKGRKFIFAVRRGASRGSLSG